MIFSPAEESQKTSASFLQKKFKIQADNRMWIVTMKDCVSFSLKCLAQKRTVFTIDTVVSCVFVCVFVGFRPSACLSVLLNTSKTRLIIYIWFKTWYVFHNVNLETIRYYSNEIHMLSNNKVHWHDTAATKITWLVSNKNICSRST